jgi:FkbM family methyltransferase
MELPFDVSTSLPTEAQHAVERWLCAPSSSRYVFGRTVIAKQILQHYSVGGVIDDFTQEPSFEGRPVFRSSDLPAKAPVLSAVIGKPASIKTACEKYNLDHTDFFAFQKHCGHPDINIRFWRDCPADIDANMNAYANLWHSLADKESQRVLASVLSLRLSGDLSVMTGFTERQHEQYFEDFLSLKKKGEVFLDIGGFDGLTSVDFAKRCPDYESIHVFEPDPFNVAILDRISHSLHRMKIHPIALGSEQKTLRLTSDHSRSHINENGEHEVLQVRLDDLDIRYGSLLKMDIEGAEIDAISGGREFIKQNQPRLAIAAYHKVDDLWRIPAAIAPLMEADIYLRHYTEGLDETIMFFIPRSRAFECVS